MITKEELKKEVDNLPENLLDEVHAFLKDLIGQKEMQPRKLTKRDFYGKLDKTDIRRAAYVGQATNSTFNKRDFQRISQLVLLKFYGEQARAYIR